MFWPGLGGQWGARSAGLAVSLTASPLTCGPLNCGRQQPLRTTTDADGGWRNMFAALVLAGIVAAPIGTICLLIQPSRRRRVTGTWPTTRRLLFAVGGTVVLAVLAGLLVRLFWLFGGSELNAIAGDAGLAVGSLIWLPVTRRWTARGHLCWSATIFLFVVYLAFVLDWTFSSDLGPAGTAGGLLLWVFEVFA